MKKLLLLTLFATLVFGEYIRDKKLEIVSNTTNSMVWQDSESVNFELEDWIHADFYCEELEYAGYDDWRLPSLKELLSIVDVSKRPSIKDGFGNVRYSGYWSSTRLFDESDENDIYFVNFNDGSYKLNDKNKKHYVRCVRGEPYNNYDSYSRDSSAEFIKDINLNIDWQDNVDVKSKKMDYSDAKEYCDNLVLGSKCDWRLPTIDELWSIIDFAKEESTNISDDFKYYAKKGFYWSATPDIINDSYIRIIIFKNGSNAWAKKRAKGYVRCVRDE